MQHHDAITGTEKQHVARDYVRLLDNALQDSLLVARQAFKLVLCSCMVLTFVYIKNRSSLRQKIIYIFISNKYHTVTFQYVILKWRFLKKYIIRRWSVLSFLLSSDSMQIFFL